MGSAGHVHPRLTIIVGAMLVLRLRVLHGMVMIVDVWSILAAIGEVIWQLRLLMVDRRHLLGSHRPSGRCWRDTRCKHLLPDILVCPILVLLSHIPTRRGIVSRRNASILAIVLARLLLLLLYLLPHSGKGIEVIIDARSF